MKGRRITICTYCNKEIKEPSAIGINIFKFNNDDGVCCKECLNKKKKEMTFPAEIRLICEIGKDKNKTLEQMQNTCVRALKFKNVSYIVGTFKVEITSDKIHFKFLTEDKKWSEENINQIINESQTIT